MKPVLVTGMPRSGTSLVMGIFVHCGAWVGDIREPSEINPTGFFENLALLWALRGGCRRKSLLRVESTNEIDPGMLGPRFTKVMKQQGYKGGPWAFKALYGALFIDAWLKTWPDSIVLVTHREQEAVFRSLDLAESIRENHSTIEAREVLWEKMQGPYARCVELGGFRIDTQAVVDSGGQILRPHVEDAGLVWNQAAVRAFVDPALWHMRSRS